MKKTTFQKQHENIAQAAHNFVNKKVKTKIVLATSDELDSDDNLLHKLPIIETVGKYMDYDSFGVVEVEKRNGEIILHAINKEDGDKKEFKLTEIDNDNVCFLADELSKKL